MKVNQIVDNKVNFRGPLDGIVTSTLNTLNSNPMANAVGIDLFAMVGPRTYVDSKERNKYAGFETFFREISGTFINCLSAGLFAIGISKVANKFINPNTKINTNSWFTNDSIEYLQQHWENTKNSKNYIANIIDTLTGRDGKNINKLKDINWENVEWINRDKWAKFTWDNAKFQNIHTKLNNKENIINTLTELIENKEISKKDTKQLLDIIGLRLTNVLGAENIETKVADKKLSANIHNLLKNAVDLGKDVFTNKNINTEQAIKKILKLNNVKSIGAVILASVLGLTNQYINRKITEKRTGKKGFVGNINYQNQNETQKKQKSILPQKILASLGMIAMVIAVMKVKNPKDFLKKLEFTGPVTSGNVIKTVYMANIIGRFMAADGKDELRESVTRDYFGFLNWLVLGGFAAKGVANILDKKKENLFNITKDGKGIKHWLNDLSLKSHSEIAAKGGKFAKENLWKLNIAHIAGLAYSTIMLGVLLPKINIYITKHKQQKEQNNTDKTTVNNVEFTSKLDILNKKIAK